MWHEPIFWAAMIAAALLGFIVGVFLMSICASAHCNDLERTMKRRHEEQLKAISG